MGNGKEDHLNAFLFLSDSRHLLNNEDFMFPLLASRWLVVLPALTALSVSAQPAMTTAVPAAPAQPAFLAFRSSLTGYTPFTDEKVTSWKDANDTVGRIGGWREYAKEIRQPTSAGTGGSLPAAPTAGDGKR